MTCLEGKTDSELNSCKSLRLWVALMTDLICPSNCSWYEAAACVRVLEDVTKETQLLSGSMPSQGSYGWSYTGYGSMNQGSSYSTSYYGSSRMNQGSWSYSYSGSSKWSSSWSQFEYGSMGGNVCTPTEARNRICR